MKVKPISKVGSSRTGGLSATYKEIVEKIFEPNVTELDDPDKVRASWGFEDEKGRKAFIWCYKHYGKKKDCTHWSVDGDMSLLIDLFGDKITP